MRILPAYKQKNVYQCIHIHNIMSEISLIISKYVYKNIIVYSNIVLNS